MISIIGKVINSISIATSNDKINSKYNSDW